MIKIVRKFFGYSKGSVVHHVQHHRMAWFIVIGAGSFLLGWYLHSEGFKKFSEFTLVPVFEAFINRET